jgi:hypothetical protein
MIKLLSVFAVAGVGLLAMSAAVSGQDQPPQPPQPAQTPPAPAQYSADLKAGDAAPEFALPGSDGKVHKQGAQAVRVQGQGGGAGLVPESVHRWVNRTVQLAA